MTQTLSQHVVIKRRHPHPAQQQVLREAKRFNVVGLWQALGKTEMGVHQLMPPIVLEGLPYGVVAPTYKLLDEAWAAAVDLFRPLGARMETNKTERVIRLPGGGRIDFWTLAGATAETSQAGRGRKYARVSIDEAAHARYLEADWTKAIRPTLADLRGDAWFLSTPLGRNYFWRLWTKGQSGEPGYASWRMPTAENPYIHPDEITSAEQELPSDAFAQEYEAEFLADAANPFGLDAIHACITDDRGADVAVWGVDLAKSSDWTVAIGLDARGRLRGFQRWQGDWRNTTRRLETMIKGTPALVDSTGVGDPIVEELQACCPLVEGYKFTKQSKQQLMEGLAVAIQRGNVAYPDGVIVHELESFMYEYTATGVRYTAPEGQHDDCVDSLALAVRCLTTRPRTAQLLTVGGDSTDDERWFNRAEDEVIWR